MASSCLSAASWRLGLLQLLLRLVHPLLGGFEAFAGGVLLRSPAGLSPFAPLRPFPLVPLALFPLPLSLLPPLGPLSPCRSSPFFLFALCRCLALRVLRPSPRSCWISLASPPVLSASFPCWPASRLCVVAAGGSALDVLLLLDEHADRLEVFAQAGLRVLDASSRDSRSSAVPAAPASPGRVRVWFSSARESCSLPSSSTSRSNRTPINCSLLCATAFFSRAARRGSLAAFSSAIRSSTSSRCLYLSAMRPSGWPASRWRWVRLSSRPRRRPSSSLRDRCPAAAGPTQRGRAEI